MTRGVCPEERTAILDGLASDDEEFRRGSVDQLLLLPTEDAVAKLCECLGDPSWRVRKAAIERLVTRRHGASVQERLISPRPTETTRVAATPPLACLARPFRRCMLSVSHAALRAFA